MIGVPTTPSVNPPVDYRTLCGIKGCNERAFSLFAWPNRAPVPLCSTHGEMVKLVVSQMTSKQVPAFNPGQWVKWLRESGKEHLFGAVR